VLPTVDLDHELALEADEIENLALERNLPPEFDALKPPVAQQEPNLALSVSRDPSHLASVLALQRAH